MLSLLWIIPASLGITWIAYRALQVGYLFVCGVFEWLWSPAGQRAVEKLVTRTVAMISLGVVGLIVLRVLAEATK
jgi:hypothetical protein